MAEKQVFWSQTAIRDLEDIHNYISEDSPIAAQQQINNILDREEQLIQQPESGQKLP